MLYNNRNMNRPQKTIKAPTRLIEEETPQPKKAKATPKRTLNLDVPKVVVKDSFVEDVINRPKTTTRKTKAGVKTTLHLDLSDVPPSDDRKFSKDWAMDDIWFKNFYTPNDNTTKLYAEAVMNIEFLPANFVYDPQYKENYGFANLELKEELKRPMKKIPLFSKLERGDYHTAASNSDDNIAGSIKFFRNNLPSFKKYKNQDDISWVVDQHRQLTAEIFDYYSKKASQRVATLKGRFNAITRIFRIAFETKNYDLYDKYSSLVIFLNQYYESDDNQNELSDIEKKKFITFDVVLDN